MREPELITKAKFRNDQRTRTRDVELLADWLDTIFRVPGLNLRFGLDALLGLVPGIGDTVSAVASFYILDAARRQGVSLATIARMAGNIAVDYAVGAVPVVGDVFDLFWKANQKNVALLRDHLETTPAEQRRARKRDRLFVAGLIAALVALLVGSITIGYFIVVGLWHGLHALIN
jgi:hypothetical protein